MAGERRGGWLRSIAAASALVIALIAITSGLTVWRYLEAAAQARTALDARADARATAVKRAAFGHGREAVNEVLFEPSPALLREVRAQQAGVHRGRRQPGGGRVPAGEKPAARRHPGAGRLLRHLLRVPRRCRDDPAG